MTAFRGTKDDDDLTGTTGNDTFNLRNGGDDGDDKFSMGASLNAADRIDGDDGLDTVILHGDYSAGLTLADDTISNIDVLRLVEGFSYNLTLADGNVVQSAHLTVNAAALEAGQTLTFDGSKESNGHLIVLSGAGDDLLTGGRRADVFDLSAGGNDTVHAGDGNDKILMGDTLTSADVIDGGAGNDTVELHGDYASGLTFSASTIAGIETLKLDDGFSYKPTTNDANVASGATLSVDASALTAGRKLTFDGSAETNGFFAVTGGAGGDHIIGGNKGDTITGGGGADVFAYTGAAQSTSTAHDTITDFAAGTDKFDTTVTVSSFFATPINHTVNAASFDSDLNSAGDDALPGHQAWIVHANGGNLIGHDFLVVDVNGNAQYNAGTDYVIDITGHTGTVTAGDFI